MPNQICVTSSVRACGKATPLPTNVVVARSRASTCATNFSGSRSLVLPVIVPTISRTAASRVCPRRSRTTCVSSSTSARTTAMDAEEMLDSAADRSYRVNDSLVANENTQTPSSVERSVSVQRSIYDPGYVNAMSHFYRGELSRIMVWRQRLDITTNWAITSSTAIITIAFSNRDVPHIIFFFNLAIVWGMLWIEARRYRFYDAFRARVRMLEAHFLVPMVMENRQMLQGEWKKLVCEDLILPCFKISRLEAIGRRLKRNYVFIFILIMVAWITKIFLHAAEPIVGGRAFYRALSVGHIHSWFVAVIFIATFGLVIGITVYVGQKTSGEISEFGAHRSLWKI